MRVLVAGPGAVGARVVRQLAEADDVTSVLVAGSSARRCEAVVAAGGPTVRAAGGPDVEVDVAVLTGPAGTAVADARRHLRAGRAVVATTDSLADARLLLDLDAEAQARGVPVVVGAGFSPGLSCLLARHAASQLDVVDEIHLARTGTGGPACARQHHRALRGTALDWRDGGWQRRRAGTGRELCWFPDPIGARDCYAAEIPDPVLLVRAVDGVRRVTGRMAATRRDRLTARLPMLRPPHPEGLVGALRVEVRGRIGSAHEVVVLGALDRPAVATAAVATTAARWAGSGRIAPGAGSLARVDDPVPFLAELAHVGIRAATFEGGT